MEPIHGYEFSAMINFIVTNKGIHLLSLLRKKGAYLIYPIFKVDSNITKLNFNSNILEKVGRERKKIYIQTAHKARNM